MKTARTLLAVSALLLGATAVQAQTPTLYSHGDPTAEEQYLLEKLNHARMDPVGEGQRLAAWLRGTATGQGIIRDYGTSLEQVVADFAAMPAVPPLALDARLVQAARAHAADLAAHGGDGPNGDGHAGWDGSTPDSRVMAAGFRDPAGQDGYAAENTGYTYRTADNHLDVDHASYMVDWGVSNLGHRKNAMAGAEMNIYAVGLGTSNSKDGRLFVTAQDYGMAGIEPISTKPYFRLADAAAYAVGVVYTDVNVNGQYDVGEGVSGVTVTMDDGAYYTVTSTSGGYALPLVRADGSYVDGAVTVHATGLPGGAAEDHIVSVSTVPTQLGSYRANAKWDVVTGRDLVTVTPTQDASTATLTGGGTLSRSARNALKVLVHRPAGSDTSTPLDVALQYKGTAVAGVDYKAMPATVNIPAGAESVKLKVKAMGGNGSQVPAKLTIKVKKAKAADAKLSVSVMP